MISDYFVILRLTSCFLRMTLKYISSFNFKHMIVNDIDIFIIVVCVNRTSGNFVLVRITSESIIVTFRYLGPWASIFESTLNIDFGKTTTADCYIPIKFYYIGKSNVDKEDPANKPFDLYYHKIV